MTSNSAAICSNVTYIATAPAPNASACTVTGAVGGDSDKGVGGGTSPGAGVTDGTGC